MNKYRWQAIVFVLVAFMLGCNEFIVVGVLSDIARELHVSVATVGYLVTIFATVYAISTPFITILTNRFSRYKTLMTLMVIFLIGNTLSGLANSFTVLLISRVITAVVAGAIISLIMTFASAIAPREKRANLVSWIFAGFSIASVFGVPIGTAISTSYSWHDAFYLITVISLITCGLLGWLLPKQVEQVQGSIKNQLVLLADKRIYIGIALVLFTAATMYAYYTYIRPILTTGLGFSTASLNWLLFLIGVMNILCNRFSGMLPKRDHYVEAWQAMIDARTRGLIRSIGVSNFEPEHLDRLITETGVTPAVNQIEVHPYWVQEALRTANFQRGIVTEAWSPLGRGSAALQEPVIRDLAGKYQKNVGQVILRWHTQRGIVPIPKARNLKHQRSNLDLFDFSLTADEIAAINALSKPDGRIDGQDPNEYEEFD
ncbi:MFS transporter [Levilactobacillus spicheri]